GVFGEDSAKVCQTLKFSNRRAARIAIAVGFYRQVEPSFNEKLTMEHDRREIWLRAVLSFGEGAATDWLIMQKGIGNSCDEEINWLSTMPVKTENELAIRGDELSRLTGRMPGPWIAAVLKRLLEDTALGHVANEKASLMEAAVEHLASEDYR